MAVTPPSSFFWGQNGAQLTPEEIARQRLLADQVLMQAGDTSPVGSWTQGAARVVNAIGGVLKERRLNQAEAANTQTNKDLISGLLGTSGVSPQSVAAPGSSASVASPSSSTTAGVASPSGVQAPAFANDGTALGGYLSDPSQRATLPAGMRNNNPGNIKFVGQKTPGIVGPSTNTDQGDPQAVFATPEAGMSAMYQLALRKYNGGKKSTNDLIAGNMGWTPGNYDAAANVANSMGIKPTDDINLNDPTMAARFMKGLILQEHGQKGALYPDAMISSVVGAQPSTATAYAPAQTPGQVASLDPSAGMSAIPPQNVPGAGMPVTGTQIPVPQPSPGPQQAIVNPATMTTEQLQAVLGPIQSQQQPAQSGYADPTVTTAYQQPAQTASQAIAQQAPQQAQGGIMADPNAAAASPQQQVAQALVQRNVAPTPQVAAVPPPAAPQVQQQSAGGIPGLTPAIVAALTSPAASPATKQIAGLLVQQAQARAQAQQQFLLDQQKAQYEQQLKQQDPAYQANLAQTRAQTENLTNPRMSPSEAANNDLANRKFAFDQQNATMTPETRDYVFSQQPGNEGFAAYQQALRASGAQKLTLNTGENSGKFSGKGDELAAARLSTMMEEGNAAPSLIGDMQQLATLGSQFQTGKGAQAMLAAGPYLQALGIDVKGLDAAQAYQAITSRLAPQMRAAGSGSSSDTDVRMFLQGLPNIANQPGGNDIINATFSALQQHKIAAAELASKAFLPKEAGGITWQEAESQIRKLPNPYEGFNTFRKKLESGGTGQQPAADPNVIPSNIPGVTIRRVN